MKSVFKTTLLFSQVCIIYLIIHTPYGSNNFFMSDFAFCNLDHVGLF